MANKKLYHITDVRTWKSEYGTIVKQLSITEKLSVIQEYKSLDKDEIVTNGIVGQCR